MEDNANFVCLRGQHFGQYVGELSAKRAFKIGEFDNCYGSVFGPEARVLVF